MTLRTQQLKLLREDEAFAKTLFVFNAQKNRPTYFE